MSLVTPQEWEFYPLLTFHSSAVSEGFLCFDSTIWRHFLLQAYFSVSRWLFCITFRHEVIPIFFVDSLILSIHTVSFQCSTTFLLCSSNPFGRTLSTFTLTVCGLWTGWDCSNFLSNFFIRSSDCLPPANFEAPHTHFAVHWAFRLGGP